MAGWPASAPSQCTGDCDKLGQVTVAEVVEMVNIALGLSGLDTCAAGDASGDGVITIDEIVKAVSFALTQCLLTGSAAGEAASGVEESTRDGVNTANRVVGFGKIGPGGGGAAGVLPGCPAGGSAEVVSCESNGETSTRTTIFAKCSAVDPQTKVTTEGSGTLKQTVAAPEFCATGQVPTGTQITSEFTKFTITTIDAAGQTIINTNTDRLTDVFLPSHAGCGGPDGRDAINGALIVQGGRAGASANASYTYRDLSIDTQSVTLSAGCIVSNRLNGTLVVDDQSTGRRFSATSRGFTITTQQVEGASVVTDAGALVTDCLGRVNFSVIEALRIDPASPCPLAGVLQVMLPDGTVSRIRYTPNGVAFDFNGDGEFDKRVDSCMDSTLTQCHTSAPASPTPSPTPTPPSRVVGFGRVFGGGPGGTTFIPLTIDADNVVSVTVDLCFVDNVFTFSEASTFVGQGVTLKGFTILATPCALGDPQFPQGRTLRVDLAGDGDQPIPPGQFVTLAFDSTSDAAPLCYPAQLHTTVRTSDGHTVVDTLNGVMTVFIFQGSPCDMDCPCEPGFCRDGVCCEEDCQGGICNLPDSPGLCIRG